MPIISYCSIDIKEHCRAQNSVNILYIILRLNSFIQLYDLSANKYNTDMKKLIEEYQKKIPLLNSMDQDFMVWPELRDYLQKVHNCSDGLARYRLFTCYYPYSSSSDFSNETLTNDFSHRVYKGDNADFVEELHNNVKDSLNVNSISMFKYAPFPATVDSSVKETLLALLKRWSQCVGFNLQLIMDYVVQVLNQPSNDLADQIGKYGILCAFQMKLLELNICKKPKDYAVALGLLHGLIQYLEQDIEKSINSENNYKTWLSIRLKLSYYIGNLLHSDVTERDYIDVCSNLYNKLFDAIPSTSL